MHPASQHANLTRLISARYPRYSEAEWEEILQFLGIIGAATPTITSTSLSSNESGQANYVFELPTNRPYFGSADLSTRFAQEHGATKHCEQPELTPEQHNLRWDLCAETVTIQATWSNDSPPNIYEDDRDEPACPPPQKRRRLGAVSEVQECRAARDKRSVDHRAQKMTLSEPTGMGSKATVWRGIVEAAIRDYNGDPRFEHTILALLLHIGSPETIGRLQSACSIARGSSQVYSDEDITSSVKALHELQDKNCRTPILRRWHALRIVRFQDAEIGQLAKTEKLRRRLAATKVLRKTMSNAYPNLPDNSAGYKSKYDVLKQEISRAKHWCDLEREFSLGILAIIPHGQKGTSISNSSIERMTKPSFHALLHVLKEVRGTFLRVMSQQLINVFNILVHKDMTTYYKFEDALDIPRMPYDSSALLDICNESSTRGVGLVQC